MDDRYLIDEVVKESHIGELKTKVEAINIEIKKLEKLREKIILDHLEKYPNDVLDL